MRATCLLSLLLLSTPAGLPAQQDSVARRHDAQGAAAAPSWRRAAVHWGKWLPVGAAVTLTAMGAHEHDRSQREFRQLLAICRANNADCLLGPDGRYLNPAAEGLYQSSLTFDRRARSRLLAGQAALIVAAGLFIIDLRRHSGGPGNIPLAPLEVSADPSGRGARVGLRVAF